MYLIEMWKHLVNNDWQPIKITKDEYSDISKNMVKRDAFMVGWVGFNCSYSGKFFGGYAGETKTKDGGIRDYQAEAISNITNQVPRLKGDLFENKSYSDLEIPENSIIYCDPPYKNTSKYKTGDFNHDTFWQWVRDMNGKGHEVYTSEYTAPDDFICIWEKEVKSSLSANGTSGGSKVSVEKLFVYNKQKTELKQDTYQQQLFLK